MQDLLKLVRIAIYIDDEMVTNGGARPLINWARSMPDDCVLISKSRIPGLDLQNYIIVDSLLQASRIVQDFSFLVVSDNKIKSGIKIIKGSKTRLAVYCQVPFGLHALGVTDGSGKIKNKFLYKIIGFIPFKLLVYRHVKMLKSAEAIFANSLSMNALLTFVYGITPTAIIFPPIDVKKFYVIPEQIKESILVFVGRDGDLNEYSAFDVLGEISREYGVEIVIFGSASVPNVYLSKLTNYRRLKNISDSELTKQYNKSYVTISIQKQEYFGYVPIESLLCGTPAITFYFHDASIVNASLKKYLVHTDLLSLKSTVLMFIELYKKENVRVDASAIARDFSATKTATDLLESLRRVLNY